MLRIDRILFPTDFSRCAEQALSEALFLAESFEAELHLLHAVVLHQDDPANPDLAFPEPDELLARMFDIAAGELAALVEKHRRRPLELREFRERGFSAAQVILEHVRTHDIDLVVMGTHGRRGAARLMFGSVADEVVRHAECPVLALRELPEARTVEAIERILVPIDFSDHSGLALAHARELAAAYEARLELLHVVERPVYPYFYTPDVLGPPAGGKLEKLLEASRRELERLVESSQGAQVPIDYRVVEGRPASEIADRARSGGADLVVMATHGLTGLERLLVGSTAEQVLRTAEAPVFLVKPFGKSLIAGEPAGSVS